MFRIAKSSESNIQVTIIEDDDMLLNNNRNENEDGDDPTEKWYLINQTKTLPQIWEMIMNAFTIYSLFATPFILVFPEHYQSVQVFELINDIFFIIDAFLSFFKIYGDYRTLPETSWHYFSGYFIFDFLSVFPGLVGNKS
jgi:hypothetical protein